MATGYICLRKMTMLDEYQREAALHHFQRGMVLERANWIREAVVEYRQALLYNPYLREAHDALGIYYQRYGLLAKAAEEFRAVANLEGDFLSFFNLGHVLIELERYEEALQFFRRCLALEPNDLATHYGIGYIHFVRREFHAALEQIQILRHSHSESWEIYHLLGNCY